jgi:LAO/AO transport system kinase
MWSMVRERLLDRLRTDEGVRAALPDVERSVRAGTLTPTLGADTLLAALAPS